MVFGFFKKKPEVVTDRLDIKVDTISASKEKKINDATAWLNQLDDDQPDDVDRFEDAKYFNSDVQHTISFSSKLDAFKFGENGQGSINFMLEITLGEDSRERMTVEEIELYIDCAITISDENGDDVFLLEDEMDGNLPAAKKFYQKFLSKLQEYENEELQRAKSNS
jgi:hypothetical protein